MTPRVSPILQAAGPVAACLLMSGAAGCGKLLPPNNFAAIWAEPATASREWLSFTHGGYVRGDGQTALVLASRRAVFLADCAAPRNRMQVLFVQGSQRCLYERLGQRPPPGAGARRIGSPPGVAARFSGKQLRVALDGYLALSERQPPDPAFEHAPRVLRVVGYAAVGMLDPAALDAPVSVWLAPESAGLAAVDAPDDPTTLLPRLPLIDVKMLVPTELGRRLLAE